MGKTRQGSLLLGFAVTLGLLAWLAGAMTASVAAEGRWRRGGRMGGAFRA